MKPLLPASDSNQRVSSNRPASILRKPTTPTNSESQEMKELATTHLLQGDDSHMSSTEFNPAMHALQIYRPPTIHLENEEEEALEVLREVVRKCTSPDAMKRPTATEVLDMLKGYL